MGFIKLEGQRDFRDIEVTGLAYDSRQVTGGEVFFCIKGLVTDGHIYAKEAVTRGARALVVEEGRRVEISEPIPVLEVKSTRRALALCSAHFFDFPSRKFKLVGITGTNGKTTTCFLLESIAKACGEKTGVISTVENRIGDEFIPVTHTTPESWDLQLLMSRMVDSGVSFVAMEVSSHALEMERVCGSDFNQVVFTNLTQDHLDFHKSFEEYFEVKSRLFSVSGNRENDYGKNRRAMVNKDDPFGRKLLHETELESKTFALDQEADYMASEVGIDSGGSSFYFEYGSERFPVNSTLRGRFNVYNCLAAMGVGVELGLEPKLVVRGAEALSGVPGRFQVVDCGQDFLLVVDYAHTPDGLENLLRSCKEITGGRVIAVFGCGGDRDLTKRPRMGRIAEDYADVFLVTSDNPRGENPQAIIDMILKGVPDWKERDGCYVIPDRREAILKAVQLALPGDMVVIAGKGHETGQIFADRVIPFDDREVVREVLEEVTGDPC